MHLSDDQMARQSHYESVLFFLDRMIPHGIITEDEYKSAKDYLAEKYKPIIRH